MVQVARGKALVAKLRANPDVRDAEALAAFLGRKKKLKLAARKAKDKVKHGNGNKKTKTRADVKDLARRKGEAAKAKESANKITPEDAVTREPGRTIPPSVLRRMTDAQLQSRNRRLLSAKASGKHDPRAIDISRDEVYRELDRRGKLSPGFYESWKKQLARRRAARQAG